MNEEVETAVEWLYNKLKLSLPEDVEGFYYQALEMEKKQIIEAHGIKENHGFEMEVQQILSKMESEGWEISDDFKTAHGHFLQYFLETIACFASQ